MRIIFSSVLKPVAGMLLAIQFAFSGTTAADLPAG